MASSLTVTVVTVLCLILIQNQVYSKPTGELDSSKETKSDASAVPQPDQSQADQPQSDQPQSNQAQSDPQTQPQTAVQPHPQTQTQTPAAAETQTPVTEAPGSKVVTKSTTTVSSVTRAAAIPASQASEKKDGKDGGSAVVVANYGLLVLGACLLLRL